MTSNILSVTMTPVTVSGFLLEDSPPVPCEKREAYLIRVTINGETQSSHTFWHKGQAEAALREAKRTLDATPDAIPDVGRLPEGKRQ